VAARVGRFVLKLFNSKYMAKTTEIEIVCESAQCHSNYDSKIRVTVELDSADMSALINAIPQDEFPKYLSDEVFEEWARDNGYVKEEIAE
jgi:hypothetical protein